MLSTVIVHVLAPFLLDHLAAHIRPGSFLTLHEFRVSFAATAVLDPEHGAHFGIPSPQADVDIKPQ